MLENPSIIANPRLREKIESNREKIESNREMVRLDDHLELPEPWDSLEIKPRYQELLSALRDCEFKSLIAEVEAEAALSEGAALQGELF